MAQVYDQVQAALEERLLECDSRPIHPTTGRPLIAFENSRFEPIDDQPWWRATFAPTTVDRGSYGQNGYSRADGEMVVDLFYPAGEGSGEARKAADDLIEYFKSGTRMTSDDGVTVSVWRAYRMPGLSEPRWYHIPVHIWWTVHRKEL